MKNRKDTLNVLCYSQMSFNDIMRENDWYLNPPAEVAVISICSPNDEDPFHWFAPTWNVLNVDFDDFDPSRYWNGLKHDDVEMSYDYIFETFPKYISKENVFEYIIDDAQTGKICAMTVNQAYSVMMFIQHMIDRGIRTFYIHCSAGLSRSQGVVRYIMDQYGDEFNIETNPDNPCNTPNYHVVTMLKRMDRKIFGYAVEDDK